MRQFLLFLIILFLPIALKATHNRAGEITFKALCPNSNNTCLTYEINIVTYTSTLSSVERCSLMVYLGDGDSLLLQRVNGPNGSCSSGTMGEIIPGTDTKKNIYRGVHTYPGPGQYKIHMIDPNRNAGVNNIVNSVNTQFYIETLLSINGIMGNNSSPELLNPPIDIACVGSCFLHNPGAWDPDGDSLSYKLVQCLGEGGNTIPGFVQPNISGGGALTLDSQTGDFIWCSPLIIGEYNAAILIEEWRRFGKNVYKVGQILRDMQIDVKTCNNLPPDIKAVNDTCIEAGKTFSIFIKTVDPDSSGITVTATGGPFQTIATASFNTVSSTKGTVVSKFTWTPNCNQTQKNYYLLSVKAKDGFPQTPLVDFESVLIRVVAPGPTNVKAVPSGSSVILSWNAPANCSKIVGYKVYRKNECNTWKHKACETGVPDYSGYKLITEIKGTSTTTYTDNDNGSGLIHGVYYSYLIVASFADGSESYSSDEICTKLNRDVPIITNTDVLTTNAATGKMRVKWVKPLGEGSGSVNLDTVANPGPYEYRLLRANGNITSGFSTVATFSTTAFYQLTIDSFIDQSLNTADLPYTYRIDFYANKNFIGSSHTASSIYLSIAPTDNKLNLTWKEDVPWENYLYHIYKETSPGTFVKIGTSTTPTYTDIGLVNGATYCYKILSEGKYTDTTIAVPLWNYSEIKCDKPIDLIAPCPPVLSVTPNCDALNNLISWNNPNHSCADDVVAYKLYFTPIENEPFQLLKEFKSPADTFFLNDSLTSIAGCYVVTAIDSFMNESGQSVPFCVDNCPWYSLPNVFTPNGDGLNELFTPFPGARFIKDVDMIIYDRWGKIVYRTNDLYIRWNGEDIDSHRPCSDGVYYYVCMVNEIRYTGIKSVPYKGFFHLFREKNSNDK